MRNVLAGGFCSIVFILCAAVPASGGIKEIPPEVDPGIANGTAAKELREAKAVWKENRVGTYRIRVNRFCFCATPNAATIKVRRGKVVKVNPKKWYGPFAVGGFFKVVSDAIKGEAASLEVKYDKEFGYPRDISIDHIAMAVDDEIGYKVRLKLPN